MKMKKWHKIALSAVALGAACGLGYYFGIHNKVNAKELDDIAWSGYIGGIKDGYILLNNKTPNLIEKDTFKEYTDELLRDAKLTIDRGASGNLVVTRNFKDEIYKDNILL